MFFVAALLWFTIGFRNAMLTIIAIPFSLLTAIVFFPILDISINSSTLIGMLLVSGMLVDDAIIVLENIYRKIEEGMELHAAVLEGANEVLWPVTVAVTTTIAAFAPLLLVAGTAGKFVSVMPKCVVVCLAASLFECLLILPAHYLDFGSRHGTEPGRPGSPDRATGGLVAAIGGLRRRTDAAFDRLRDAYRRVLRPVITHRASFAVLLAAFLTATFAAGTRLRFELFPGEFSNYSISLETPPDFSLERTSALTEQIEALILELPEDDVDDFNTVVGLSVDLNYDRILAPNLALTTVAIPQTEANQLRPQDVMARAQAKLDAFRRGSSRRDRRAARRVGSLRPTRRPSRGGAHPERGLRDQQADRPGDQGYLTTIPGVSGIDDSLKEGPREIRLRIDDDRAAAYGLTFDDLARALRAANDGSSRRASVRPPPSRTTTSACCSSPDQRDRVSTCSRWRYAAGTVAWYDSRTSPTSK